MLHLQKVVRRPLDMLADVVSVSGTIEQRPQNEHIQRALQQIGALLCLFRHGRQSTLVCGSE
jgi:hypothetical protein